MSGTPQFSLVANAIRPNFWKRFCNSLANNKATYEVIFVGPKSPVEKMPSFFKYIQSNTKPSQRMEIAVRAAKGKIISLTSDDINYNHADLSGRPVLDVVWKEYQKYNDWSVMFAVDTFEEYHDGMMRGGNNHRWIFGDKTTPLMRTNGFSNREFYTSLGGYDRNFIAGQADNDCVLRAYARGARAIFVPEAQLYVHHKEAHQEQTSQGMGWDEQDRKYLESCWVKADGSLSNFRLKPFVRFMDDDILNVNQGVVPECVHH